PVRHLDVLGGDKALDPARVQVDVVARTAADVRQVLDAESQPARPGRAEHKPVRAARKELVVERLRELFVVPEVVFPAYALLRHPGSAAGLEDVERPSLIGFGYPALVLFDTEPLVLKVWKPTQVGECTDLVGWIPACLFRPVQP